MSTETLRGIISDFNPEDFIHFFRQKNRSFKPFGEDAPQYHDENFTDALYIGEIPFDSIEKLIIYTFKVDKDLTERSGKKAQYEKGKRILREQQADAGIFIFYDSNGRFRFSLIHTNYTGTRRQWSSFKRSTYFVSPDEHNKTFLQRIGGGDFSSLETIKEAFSVEKVTKEFYQDIANWYFYALKEVRFPYDAEAEPNGRNISLIRLITRLIFIWFMRQKGIVKRELFDIRFLKGILKDLSPEKGTYYLAILQNLFFATLNTPIEQRKFRREERYRGYLNKDYMNHTYFRHHSLFKDAEKMKELFNDIPFLNGGLFECLDKSKDDESNDTGREIRIDGFSDDTKKQPYVPNFLFFSEEREVDLNEDYGTKNKKYKIRGIIDILSSYNFTIDENTPVDEEIALDPELLGRVFENLLASYNPETATTARKATGSYYTPREIVDYMVRESLKEYFKTNVADIDEDKLNQLFLYDGDTNPFDEATTERLINAIHNLKLLDPAVGSGAFPMGALHCLVYILHKLDPHNERWKAEQIKAVSHITDPKIRQETLEKIEESFTLNELDYGRKLYLIQNCIYGVDIQPIAIQIAKLRFFISLLVDEKVDKTKPNYGIEPLPNLETRFVAANTLIGLPRPQQLNLMPDNVKRLEEELKEIRNQYFIASSTKEKEKLKKKDTEIRKALAENLKSSGFPAEATEKISRWNPYDTNRSADWFDPEWMFGINVTKASLLLEESSGFDIVIGNPPYGNLIKPEQKKTMENIYRYSTLSDISSPFIERGFNLLKNRGSLIFIITYAITFNKDFSKSRELIANNFKESYIYTFDRDRCRIFKSMTQTVSIMKCFNKNALDKKGIFTSRMFRETPDINKIEVTNCNKYLLPKGATYNQPHRLPKIGEETNRQILDKLLSFDDNVESIIKNSGSRIWIRTSGNYWYNAFDRKPYNSNEISPIYVDKNFSNYLILLMNSSLFYFWFRVYGDGRHMNMDILENFPLPDREKILKHNVLLRNMKERFMDKLFSVFEKERERFLTSRIKSEIDIIDLILGRRFYNLDYNEIVHILNYDSEIRGGNKLEQPFIFLVDKILASKKHNPQANTREYERQIDQMVYKLYGLTKDEIAIVEG